MSIEPYSIVGTIEVGRVEIFLEVDRLDVLFAPQEYKMQITKKINTSSFTC